MRSKLIVSLISVLAVAAPGTATAARTETVAPVKFAYLPKQIQKQARASRADLGGNRVTMRAYISPRRSVALKRLDPNSGLTLRVGTTAPVWVVTYKGRLEEEGEAGRFAYDTWSIRTGGGLDHGFFPTGVPKGF